MGSLSLLIVGAVAASGPGCAAPQTAEAIKAPAPVEAPSALRAMPLHGRHAMQSAVVGPGGRTYVATMDELLVFSPEDPSVGERVPFHGRLAATPSGARLYRTAGAELFEVDAAGVDGRKARFDTAIGSLTFSGSGGLLSVTSDDAPGRKTTVILRASDLREVARLKEVASARELVASGDDAYAVVGRRVVDTRTTATVYEHDDLERAAVRFEEHRLFMLVRDRLTTVVLETGRSTEATLPCSGSSRAAPAAHRFVTRCSDATIVTTVGSGATTFEQLPAGTSLVDAEPGGIRALAPSARVAASPRFSGHFGRALRDGAEVSLRDGELVVPGAASVRIAPPSGRTVEPSAPARVRSDDGSFSVELVASPHAGVHSTLSRLDARSGKVESTVAMDDPSYRSPRLLGLLGERLVVMPDGGTWADVVLLDARTFQEKERYFFGKDSMLHVREDGTFETTGDAAPLENLILCTDGHHFVPAARCARAAR
ncbi:MAG TPA: hypothetical protein VLT33_39760 [Labilithrix sp.]|nr:hypothetical protein [Labilithrix sp.]